MLQRSLLLLVLCQGLFLTHNVVFIAINGLVGLALAPEAWMATLPVAGYVVGGALCTGFVARTQQRYGRKRSFQWGLIVAAASAAMCAYAAATKNFAWLVVATVIAGYYNANASLYRFAGPELVSASFKEKAISLVLAGGIIGAVAGPNLANHTKGLMAAPFAASYLSLVGVALLGLLAISFVTFPAHPVPASGAHLGRPLSEIARQPRFVVACVSAALGYGVMNLLMAATPIAMQRCSLPFGDAALVLEWHVLGMFVPSFFTGHLIKRLGLLPVMATGVVLNVLCVVIALQGVELANFFAALIVLGIGWNFLYVGGSTLLTATYRSEEKTKVQGAMDFCVFATMAATSVASGALITTEGWAWLQRMSLLPIGLVGLALVWLAVHQRRAAPV